MSSVDFEALRYVPTFNNRKAKMGFIRNLTLPSEACDAENEKIERLIEEVKDRHQKTLRIIRSTYF